MTKIGGVLILVTGPSGVGKDTLLEGVRAQMIAERRIRFAQRVITRPASAGGEKHIAASTEEFLRMKAEGAFWSDWQAHGLYYGLPVELHTDLLSGTSVLANVSRGVTDTLARLWPQTVVIEIRAPSSITRQRLRQRGRESDSEIAQRAARKVRGTADFVKRISVDNNGSREAGIERFRQAISSALKLHANGAYQLEDQIGFLLRRAHQYASGIFQEHMSALSLTPPQFAALATVHQQKIVSQNQLGRLIDTDPATMQGIVKRLADREYIERHPDVGHKRKINLRLTEDGHQVLETAINIAREVSDDTLAALAEDEKVQLLSLLSKLVNGRTIA